MILDLKHVTGVFRRTYSGQYLLDIHFVSGGCTTVMFKSAKQRDQAYEKVWWVKSRWLEGDIEDQVVNTDIEQLDTAPATSQE